MKIFIASDHGGYDLKQYILENYKKFEIVDLGTHDVNSCDYPVYAQILCNKINSQEHMGILICKSGIGMSIAANRFKNIRAALCFNNEMCKLARMHNDANVLCLGSSFLNNKQTLEMLDVFFNTKFESGRHSKRISIINSDLNINN